MNILYCGDSHIRDGLLLSLLSLTRQVSEPLQIFVLTMSFSTPEKDYLPISQEYIDALRPILQAANPESDIMRIDISERFQQETPASNLQTRFTPYCMLRLFADELPEIPDRLLYLDTDVLCRAGLSEFYWQDIEDFEFAAVLDYYGSWLFRRKKLRRAYCNSGVMLLNMAEIRRTGLFARCRQLCFTKKMFMPDQTALNKLCTAKKICPRRYNEQRRLHADTVLQHFTTSFRLLPPRMVSVKPWMEDEVHNTLRLSEYDELFRQYHMIKENSPCLITEN